MTWLIGLTLINIVILFLKSYHLFAAVKLNLLWKFICKQPALQFTLIEVLTLITFGECAASNAACSTFPVSNT